MSKHTCVSTGFFPTVGLAFGHDHFAHTHAQAYVHFQVLRGHGVPAAKVAFTRCGCIQIVGLSASMALGFCRMQL